MQLGTGGHVDYAWRQDDGYDMMGLTRFGPSYILILSAILMLKP